MQPATGVIRVVEVPGIAVVTMQAATGVIYPKGAQIRAPLRTERRHESVRKAARIGQKGGTTMPPLPSGPLRSPHHQVTRRPPSSGSGCLR